MSTRLLFIHALSPLHVGVGHAPGAIDLPIARDKATGFPILPGSGLKGVLRAACTATSRADVQKVFGPETANASEHAGALHLGDAYLLCLPVRSIAGTFAWATSPYLLQRFARDAREAGLENIGKLPTCDKIERALVPQVSDLLVDNRIYLEDLDFAPQQRPEADALAKAIADYVFPEDKSWQDYFAKRFVVLHDDVMAYLAIHGMAITNRIRLENDTKTVANGALWTEESIPTESVMVALALAQPNKGTHDAKKVMEILGKLTEATLQVGGKATVGRGRCRFVVAGGAK